MSLVSVTGTEHSPYLPVSAVISRVYMGSLSAGQSPRVTSKFDSAFIVERAPY